MKNKKHIIFLSAIIGSTIIGVTVISLISNNHKRITSANTKLNIVEEKTADQYIDEINSEKVFYMKSEYSFEYKPTIENMYNMSDIVLIGTHNDDIETYADGVDITTRTKFDTLKVLKNEININVKDSVTFDRIGGTMKLSDYMKGNKTIRTDEFTNIPIGDRSDYYVVEEFSPNNELSFSSAKATKHDKYIIFLNYSEEENKLMLNSAYYGMRKIDGDEVYDYDTKQFIKVTNNEINKVLVDEK